MNRGPASLHRLTVGVVGLLMASTGIVMILHRTGVDPIAGWVDDLDPNSVAAAIDRAWWIAVLVGLGVLALAWGWSLLATAVRPGRVGDLRLEGSGPDGDLTVAPKIVASAAEDELRRQPTLASSTVTATDDRDRSIIRIVVTSTPDHSYRDVLAVLTPTLDDLHRALDGSDIHLQAFVHFE